MRNYIYTETKGELVELSEQPYDSENILQTLLARHPNLLAGAQMDEAAPLRSASRRLEIAARLNLIPGVNVPPDAIGRRPTIALAELAEPQVLEQFLAVFDWYLTETRQPSDPHA